MTSEILNNLINEPAYYHRQYENDQKYISSLNFLSREAQRVTFIALPFLSLYKPINPVISIGLNAIRSFSSYKQISKSLTEGSLKDIGSAIFHGAITTTSVVGNIFGHRYSLIIASAHDILINSLELLHYLSQKQYTESLEKFLELINHSLYLTVLFYGSVEIIVVSLVIQVFLELFKSQKSFRTFFQQKDTLSFIEGFAHLLMACIRFSQVLPHCQLLGIKYKSTQGTYNETLGLYEDVIERLLGKNYLHFTSGDQREKLLILNTSEDWNGVFDPREGHLCKDLLMLQKRFDIRFHTISKIEDIEREINLAAQTGKVTALMLRAHGTSYSMEFGSDPIEGVLRKNSLSPTAFKNLDPNCIIILDSCKTAKYENGLAYYIANLAKRVTYAADSSITENEPKLITINPLIWSFDRDEAPHTKKILPQQEPTAV